MDRGDILLGARRRKRMSQEHLASVSGVSVRTIRRAETGEEVSGETLRCLCAVLEVDVEKLPGANTLAIPGDASATPVPDAERPWDERYFPGRLLLIVLQLNIVCAAPLVTVALMPAMITPMAAWFTLAQALVGYVGPALYERISPPAATILLGLVQACAGVLWLVSFGAVMPVSVQVAEIVALTAGIALVALGIREQGRDYRAHTGSDGLTHA